LRVGGSAMMGLTLGHILKIQSAAAAEAPAAGGGVGWNRAKSLILVYLQGGPSHIDLWDPKDNVPDNVRSAFKRIKSKVAGMDLTEALPKFADVTDKITMVRTMSYTPNGLFNHTAAIYQMMTGYTADKVSPSVPPVSLSRPRRRIFPTSARTSFGSSP
jgi:hypothetical protein